MLKLRSADLNWRVFDGETVLLDLGKSMYMHVNRSATVLWEKLAEGTTRDALVRALIDEYSLAEDQATDDVDAFLADCRARNLIEDDESA